MDSFLTFLMTPAGFVVIFVALIIVFAAIAGFRHLTKKELEKPPSRPELSPGEGESAPPEQPITQEKPGFEAGPEPPTVPTTGPLEEDATAEATPEQVPVVDEEAPKVEVPESLPSRMERLRGRLAKSGSIGKALLGVLSRGELSAADWEEIEDTLLMADLGVDSTEQLMDVLRTKTKVASTTDPGEARQILADELLELVDPKMDRSLNLEQSRDEEGNLLPATILMVGVNGTGKTTTVGKLSRILVADGKSVLLGAADTFRAAAVDQLATWGSRVGVDVVRSDREGADPASVAFEAVKEGAKRGMNVVLVDTAGRLQNKSALMDELGKVKRVMERRAPVNEVLLVLDATIGQNGMRQAQAFAEVTGVTGIVLTKLDGSARGGIVVSAQKELGVPVKFVGLGEGPDDLAPFDCQDFVNSIVGL